MVLLDFMTCLTEFVIVLETVPLHEKKNLYILNREHEPLRVNLSYKLK